MKNLDNYQLVKETVDGKVRLNLEETVDGVKFSVGVPPWITSIKEALQFIYPQYYPNPKKE